jgi:hypothetical protein
LKRTKFLEEGPVGALNTFIEYAVVSPCACMALSQAIYPFTLRTRRKLKIVKVSWAFARSIE